MALWATPAAAAPPSKPAGAAPPSTTRTECSSRPDVAALDEYCPTLPGADGRGSNRGPKLKSVLPPKVVKRLTQAGPVGQALLGLPAAAPMHTAGNQGRGRGLDAEELLTQGRLGRATKPPGNPIRASATGATNGDIGVAFGSVLLVSSIGLAGAAWTRFRRRQPL